MDLDELIRRSYRMIFSESLLILLYLFLSLANGCYISSVDDQDTSKEDVEAEANPEDPVSPRMILESQDPVSEVVRLRDEGFNLDNVRNTEGLTLLMLAADTRKTELVLELLASGVDTSIRSLQSTKYVGGWYCVDVIPGRTAAEFAQKNGERVLGAVIDNYQKLLQLYLIRRQLLANPGGELNLSELPLELIDSITINMINLLL